MRRWCSKCGAEHHIDEYKGLMEFMTSKGYFVVVAEKYKKEGKTIEIYTKTVQALEIELLVEAIKIVLHK